LGQKPGLEFGQLSKKQCLNTTCGNYLSGKQRKWCSDACRKQAARRRKKAVRESLRLSANRPRSPSQRVRLRLIIAGDPTGPWLYSSRKQLMVAIRVVASSATLQQVLIEELERQIPGYVFDVVILPGPWD